jgi:hypothetical protein
LLIADILLARNIFLLSLIVDDKVAVQEDLLWNSYYHLYISDSDLKTVRAHAKRLLDVSKTMGGWNSSQYGSHIRFCDEETLTDVRSLWSKYAMDPTKQNAGGLEKNIKEAKKMKSYLFGEGATVATGMRSAAPAFRQAASDLSKAHEYYWAHGTITGISPSAEKCPNPLFAASLSGNLVLHYGTDPLLGFHLATAYTPLAENSPLAIDEKTQYPKYIAAAKIQFREWIKAFKSLCDTKGASIRFVSSDALAFCHMLQLDALQPLSDAGVFRRQWDPRLFVLSRDDYGAKPSAPRRFDVIETSNLADTMGTINLLVANRPLLKDVAWATIYTENLAGGNTNESDRFAKGLCGPTATMCLLLGVSPVEYWTNATTACSAHESLMQMAFGTNTVSQVRNVSAWKQNKYFAGPEHFHTPHADETIAASVLFKVYLEMFEFENPTAILTAKMAGQLAEMSRRSAYPVFHRGTFVAFAKAALKNLAIADSKSVWEHLKHLILNDSTLSLNTNYIQELMAQLMIQDAYVDPTLSEGIRRDVSGAGLASWAFVPEVVAVTIVVPRENLMRLYGISSTAKVTSPTLQGALKSSTNDSVGWHSIFGDVNLAFGHVETKGARDNTDFAISIKNDEDGWAGTSPVIASFYAPAMLVLSDPKQGRAGLAVQSNPQNVIAFASALGESMAIYETTLDDENSVYITRFLPGCTSYPAYGSSAMSIAGGDSDFTTAKLTVDFDKSTAEITTITAHLDITSKKGKELLANKQTPVTLCQTAAFEIDVVLGNKTLTYPLGFPLPISEQGSKTRIARKSSYIEVVAPLAKPVVSDVLGDLIYPIKFGPSFCPATLNIPHTNLDRLPILDLNNKDAIKWLTTLISFQFSPREKRLRDEANSKTGITRSTRLNFKESLFTMFMLASGLQGGQTGLFAINHPQRGGIHMLFFVSALRLDGSIGSVLLDVAVLPLTIRLIESGEIESFLLVLRTLQLCTLTVDDEELIIWKKVLPSLVERSRTWNHKSKCEYSKLKSIPLSTEPSKQFLCSCGNGKLPKNFINLPDWDTASKYAVRAAFSPTFPVPVVEEVIDPSLLNTRSAGAGEGPGSFALAGETCKNCGSKEAKNGGDLKKCLRCHQVKYCSVECQKKDWRKHRMECERG